MMRMDERVLIEAREKPKDFGKEKPKWNPLAKRVPAMVKDSSGRLQRDGDQMVATHDVEVHCRMIDRVYLSWLEKQPLRVGVKRFGERLGVKAMNRYRKGRLWWLKISCVRS